MAAGSAGAEARRVALFVATLSAFTTPFLGSSISVALPSIGRELALDAVALSWISSTYLLVSAISLVPAGRLADIYGRKRLWQIGTVLFCLFGLLSAAAPNGAWLIAGRGLQALGGAMTFGTGLAILTAIYPPRERGKVYGVNVAAVYSGLALGPVVGGLLVEHLGWRSLFLTPIPFGLVALALMRWRLPGEWREARGERFDLAGTLLYGLALVGLMWGASLLPGPGGLALLGAGAAGLAGFVAWELRSPSPVLDLRLFRGNAVFALSNLAAFLNYSATSAVTFLLSLYLQYVNGLDPAHAGLILLAQPVMMTALSLVAGRLSDRIEPRLLSSAGMALTTVGLLLLALSGAGATLPFIVGALLLMGVGFGLFSSPNTNAVMSAVERRYFGVASGTLGTMRLLGQMASMGVTMTLFALYLGREPIGAANRDAFIAAVHTAFLLFGLLCAVGVFASLVRGKVRGAPAESPAESPALAVAEEQR